MYMCCIYITHTHTHIYIYIYIYMYMLPNMPPFFKIYDETNINTN